MLDSYSTQELDFYMKKALAASKKAVGKTEDNPPVGCVIVEHHQILATGYTQPPGQDHAEAQALRQLESKNLEQAICFVTLEPCSFHGRTPSCAQALVRRKIHRVVVSILDPHPKNQGAGIQILKEAHMEVILGILESEIRPFLEPFLYKNPLS
ncbi:MAG: bifunctional diaminohydroxyphosphoribosylaminopyrimidine deaminase/5-amino-6-(5-phosphoribosylamino)uracil reductase RibD [Planctomycetota bacterium]